MESGQLESPADRYGQGSRFYKNTRRFVKLLAYVLYFFLVLGAAVTSKASLLLMTQSLGNVKQVSRPIRGNNKIVFFSFISHTHTQIGASICEQMVDVDRPGRLHTLHVRVCRGHRSQPVPQPPRSVLPRHSNRMLFVCCC